MSAVQLRGAIKELCAVDIEPSAIGPALEPDARFTTPKPDQFGLVDFAYGPPGQFAIVSW